MASFKISDISETLLLWFKQLEMAFVMHMNTNTRGRLAGI